MWVVLELMESLDTSGRVELGVVENGGWLFEEDEPKRGRFPPKSVEPLTPFSDDICSTPARPT